MKDPTVRAQHHAATCRHLERTYGLAEGAVYYIDLPYEEETRPAQEPSVEPVKERGRKRRKL